MTNQKAIEMLPTVWANYLNRNKWSSKVFSEEKTKGAMTFSILIGGGKSPPCIEGEVSRG
jgi:hypothetical protein